MLDLWKSGGNVHCIYRNRCKFLILINFVFYLLNKMFMFSAINFIATLKFPLSIEFNIFCFCFSSHKTIIEFIQRLPYTVYIFIYFYFPLSYSYIKLKISWLLYHFDLIQLFRTGYSLLDGINWVKFVFCTLIEWRHYTICQVTFI